MVSINELVKRRRKGSGNYSKSSNTSFGGGGIVWTPITPLTVKGGVVRVIDSATGDIARTTNGWIEDIKYGWYFFASGTGSAEFDSAVIRTGRLSLKLSTTAVASYVQAGGASSVSATTISKYGIPIKPSTTYKIKIYMKTNVVSGDATSGAAPAFITYNASASAVNTIGNTYVKTTADWTQKTIDFTTGATEVWIIPDFRIYGQQGTATLIMDAWFDVNSMTLEEVTSITNSSPTPALYYPTLTAVTSTDNIDQSQVTASGALAFGRANNIKAAQQFLPTKKNHTGVILQRNADAGTYAGNVTITLETDSSNSPSGTALATASYTNVQWEAITAATDFTVSLPATLTIDGSTKYWYVIASSTTDSSNYSGIKGQVAGSYTNGLQKNWSASVWSADTGYDAYFKTLYSKNTTNLTVSTATETVSVTAPTPDGWENGTVVNFTDALTLPVGDTDIYISSNGPTTADGTVDSSLQCTLTPMLYNTKERTQATSRSTASNRLAVRDMGTALRFGASVDDRVVIGNSSSQVYDNESDVTICASFRIDAFGDYYIFSIPATTGANRKYIAITASRELSANLGNGGFGEILPTLQNGKPYQIILVCDHTNGRARAFVNGVQVKGWTDVTYGTGNADIVLGNVTTGKSFVGIADEYRIYGKLFTDQEAYDYYFNNIISQDNTLGEWTFDEGTGDTAYDTSGNGNNGTITGATYTTDVPFIPRSSI